ncbi:hypothetical protein TSOC_012398 [Tetrabaena socialis]|uniref:Uncharacterized protein n=1 Tax=Tetrabaena socialis TaxID=47790 RepID=A0A2J7ZN66_9CHLO|nr:hypothetical protein TSOC_012964 [Tetrabaena socialis]PNH01696.1 hypothetical protein TSOC_012398 [Tetrabaena socialis]|eukprot:PNH01162.1 hypothetical protein TSOC_012964 [Tetrabaena socialis]
MKLARRGQAEQRRRPGFLARLFGARTEGPEPMPEPGGGRIEPH